MPTNTWSSYDMDGCDDCGKVTELFHSEGTGRALCEACDMAREAVLAARATTPPEPFDSLLAEREVAGLTVRLNWLRSYDNQCAINVVFDGVPMAVTVPADKAWDAFEHPMVYLAPAQVAELGIR